MKISMSFESTITNDVSILVDALRASTTITLALDNFKEIIPCYSKGEALKIYKDTNGVLAGERNGNMIEGFDIGNSPKDIAEYKTEKEVLILTTSNGTRILKNMNSTVLIGSFVNAKAVARKAIEISKGEIDVVMAGVRGDFAVEDFLASGEIIYWIIQELKTKNSDFELNDMAMAGMLASRSKVDVRKSIYKSKSGKRLKNIGYIKDIEICLKKNITENVAIYKDKKLTYI